MTYHCSRCHKAIKTAITEAITPDGRLLCRLCLSRSRWARLHPDLQKLLGVTSVRPRTHQRYSKGA